MSWFTEYIKNTDDRLLTKWLHYFDIYERELTRFRNRPINFLEIGVFKGGSVPMWREFFSDESSLVFIDIDPTCSAHAEPNTHIEIGNQADPIFLQKIVEKYGPFDVILDDGSHVCKHQIASFEFLWPHIKNQSVYMVEDCHTSYWPGFGGGYRNEASFIEFAKRKVDAIHSWYTDQDELFKLDKFSQEASGVRFYDSIVVFEKQIANEPPLSITSRNGKVKGSRKALEVRGRTSIFKDKDAS